MAIKTSSDGSLRCQLIAFDASGAERVYDPDSLLSLRPAAPVAEQPVTDVFVFSHGWLGDVPSAKKQYGNWTGALARDNGLERTRRRLAETAAAREALRVIVESRAAGPNPDCLPDDGRAASVALDHESGLNSDGPDGPQAPTEAVAG